MADPVANSGTSAPDLLRDLLADQEKRLHDVLDTDSAAEIVKKTLRKRKLPIPHTITALSADCLKQPIIYFELFDADKASIYAIHNFLRATYSQPFLVEECCQIVLAMFFFCVAAKGKIAAAACFEAVLPLMDVLKNKFDYMEAKAAAARQGLDATGTKNVIEKSRNLGSQNAIDKIAVSEKKWSKNRWAKKKSAASAKKTASSDSD